MRVRSGRFRLVLRGQHHVGDCRTFHYAWPQAIASGELEFNLAGAAAHRADNDLDVVAELGHQFQ